MKTLHVRAKLVQKNN